jgi:tetratricopeptide (TPR) repeat protein
MAVWNPRANEIFANILELPPPQRPTALEDACGADADLRRQVEALLAAHAEAGDFLDQPAIGAHDAPTTASDSGPLLPGGSSFVQALAPSRLILRDPDGEPHAPIGCPNSANMPTTHEPAGRLQLLGEIARGGMGAVLKGRDPGLGRDVAVKVLLETHQGKTELVQRFVEEAQIAGQLQHPGVVPVYDLGQFPDSRPYFTMKLVRGQTLAALLATRRDPAEERARFLGIFGQVCQTLAYAHARGVIHRDLKPGNIMVGSFGEVQVMDWGLAKVLCKGGIAAECQAQARPTLSAIQTSRSAGLPDGGSHTQAGSVMGTPAYMAPEQARGELELVDERADVFGLGAILCEILTGQPPFTGPKAEAMRKAQIAQLDDAWRRLADCGTDAELIGLARRCLAAEPWDRPWNGGEVAAAVTAYQESVAERLRQAELARAAEVARTKEARATAAAERKARQRTWALAAVVLAFMTAAAGGGLWVQRQQAERAAEQARRRVAVETSLAKVAEFQKAARWREARDVLDQVGERLGASGPADLRQRVKQAKANLALVSRLDDIFLKQATIGGSYFNTPSADQDFVAAFRDAGLGQEGDEPQVVASRIRGSAIQEQLVAALDNWASVAVDQKRRSWVLAVARGADPQDWRDRFHDLAVWQDRVALERLAGELLGGQGEKLARLSPPLLTALGDALLRAKSDAVPLLKAAQKAHPDDFRLNLRLGYALFLTNQSVESISFCRAAVALRPESEAAHNNLGSALAWTGQVDEAIQEYRKVIDLNPKFVDPHYNLGSALLHKGQLDEAIRECRIAIDLEPKFFLPHGTLGQALLQLGRFSEAREATRRCLDLMPPNHPFRPMRTRQLQDCEQYLALDQKLAVILKDTATPADNAERLALAKLCGQPFKKRYATAARFYTEAFAHDARLADDLQKWYRYNAACCAARAGCGQGADGRLLPDKVSWRLRHQALDWLKADLAARAMLLKRNDPALKQLVRQNLEHWRQDADLAGLRDQDAVAKLSAEEQEACRGLWAEVEALLQKVSGPTK